MQVNNKNETSTLLDAPGAGLPTLERHLLKAAFLGMRCFRNRASFARQFMEEEKKITERAGDLTGDDGERQVIIPRIRGIEDSSRDWSVWMTLDHLNIVNMGLLGIIEKLVAGEKVAGEVRTQDVKPSADNGPQTIEQFKKCCAQFREKTNQLENLHTEQTHKHPWFGNLNAYGWFALAAVHMGIHRQQIELIITKLP